MTTDALEQLRTDLVGAVEAHGRRSRRLQRGAAAAAVVALVLTVSLVGLWPSGAPSALAITKTRVWVELRIADATGSPEQMNRELRAAGLDAEVRLVAAPPELIGKWAGAETKPVPGDGGSTSGFDRRRDRADVDELRQVRLDSPELVRIPADYHGHVVLFAGREGKPGEPCGIPVGCTVGRHP